MQKALGRKPRVFLLLRKAIRKETATCYHTVKEKRSLPFSSCFSWTALRLLRRGLLVCPVLSRAGEPVFSLRVSVVVPSVSLFLTCHSVLCCQAHSCLHLLSP